MRKRLRQTAGLMAPIMVTALLLPGSAGTTPAPEHPIPIRLVAGTFVPASQHWLSPPSGWEPEPIGSTSGPVSYLVQFAEPVGTPHVEALRARGADVVEYIPDQAYRVRTRDASRLDQIPGVIWVGRFHPSWKVSPEVLDAYRQQTVNGLYRVLLEDTEDAARARTAVEATGARVLRTSARNLLVATAGINLPDIARLESVRWIETFEFPRTHNEYAAGEILHATIANARGYDGSTQIIAIADTGLGGGTPRTAHPDIPADRILAIHDWTSQDLHLCADVIPDGPRDVSSGHGTHVAVSALGDGDPSGVGRAAAPGARLVFQAVEDYVDWQWLCASSRDQYLLVGIPDDLGELFEQAYGDGARIHANSWGSSANGAYTALAQSADAFIHSHPDMLVTFSAGNGGVDTNNDGVIDPDSIASPATAKNVLAIGASENARPSLRCDRSLTYATSSATEARTVNGLSCRDLEGRLPTPTWGEWFNYSAAPLRDDPQAGNAQQMAAFSSRGPTDDGRIKPDVVAPGSWVLSGYSDLYQRQYDSSPNPRDGQWQNDGYLFPYNQRYKYFSGTSMANPIAAGGAAVVRDYYARAHRHEASAALIRASLVNSAVDLLDENNDGVDDNDFPIPNIHEGWGLVNLDAATDGTFGFLDNVASLSTGDVLEYRYEVAGDRPAKFTLAYSDVPGSLSAAVALVNDLDLEVVAPDGTVYRGNVFENGWSTPGGTPDRLNNLENVFIQSPQAGTWTLRIRAHQVPFGPQSFALVARGGA